MQIYGGPFVAESLRLGFANYEVLKWYLLRGENPVFRITKKVCAFE